MSRPRTVILVVTVAAAVTQAAPESDPFLWIDGTLTASAEHQGSPTTVGGCGCTEWIQHSIGFPPGGLVTANANEMYFPMFGAAASLEGWRTIDEAPGRYPPPIEAYEWHFLGAADASGDANARYDAEIEFELAEYVHVFVRAEFTTWGAVALGDLQGSFGLSLTIQPSPLYVADTVLGPGTHRLSLEGGYGGRYGAGAIDLLVRFEPAKCNVADLNADGVVDLADIQQFIDLFLGGDPAADLNDDGFVDLGDIRGFVEALLGGCE